MLSLLAIREEHRFRDYFDVEASFIPFSIREREHINQ